MMNRVQQSLALCATFLGSSCHSIDTGPQKQSSVATVNQRYISANDYQSAYEDIASFPGRDLKLESAKVRLLKELVDQELLYQEAVKAKVDTRSASIRKAMAKAYLEEYINRFEYPVTDKEIRQFFDEKKGEFEQVHARHILIKAKGPNESELRKEAKKKAEAILDEIKKDKSPVDFQAYAKKYSQDGPTGKKGGDLGYFRRNEMVPSFATAAFAIENPGEISAVVESNFGYHIIELVAARRGFDFFKPQLKNFLLQKKKKDKADALLKKLRSEARIETRVEKLKDFGSLQMPSSTKDGS